MSERGVFAVDRGIFDHPLFANNDPLTDREAWLWLLSEAAWKPRRVRFGTQIVTLNRGQIGHSLRFMASKWSWSEAKVRRFLGRLKTDAMIDAGIDAGQTIVTIRNYDVYQRVGLPDDARSDAPCDAGATQERRKEETIKHLTLNQKNTPQRARAPETEIETDAQPAERDIAFALKKGLSQSAIPAEWEHFVAHHRSRGTRFRDWRAAWQKWVMSPYRRARPPPAQTIRNGAFAHAAKIQRELDERDHPNDLDATPGATQPKGRQHCSSSDECTGGDSGYSPVSNLRLVRAYG